MKGKKVKILSLIVTVLIMVTTFYARSYNATSKVETASANAGTVSTDLPFTQEQVLTAALDVAMNGYKYGDNNVVGWKNDGITYEYLDCSTYVGTVLEKLGCTLTGSYKGSLYGKYQFNTEPWEDKVFSYVGPDGQRYVPQLVIEAKQDKSNPGWYNAVSEDGTVVYSKLEPGDIIVGKGHMFMYVGKADTMDDMVKILKQYNGDKSITLLSSKAVNYAFSNPNELGQLSYNNSNNGQSEYWFIEGNIGRDYAPRGNGPIYSERNSANINRPYLSSYNWENGIGSKSLPDVLVYRIAQVPVKVTNFSIEIIKLENKHNSPISGAGFTIKVYNKETGEVVINDDEIHYVGEFGRLSVPDISILKDATYVIKIEEKVVPTYYVGIEEPIEFEFTSNDTDGEWKQITVKNAKEAYVGDNIVRVAVGNDMKSLDLALRKSITAVNGKSVIDGYDLEANRLPEVTVDTAMAAKSQGDGLYKHDKKLVTVKKGDLVTYTMNVFNEGSEIDYDGYAKEITDYLPEGLEFVELSDSSKDEWYTNNTTGDTVVKLYNKSNKTIFTNSLMEIYTRKLSDLDDFENLYQTVSIVCKVTKSGVKLSNRAEITSQVATDDDGNIVKGFGDREFRDRDSTPGTLTNPTLDGYYDEYNKKYDVETPKRGGSYFPGEEENGELEDDVDFETVYAEPVGMIGVYKYEDTNNNGICDREDKALRGAKFALKEDKDSDEFVTEELETDENGAVFFNDLKMGQTYYVVETKSPEGYKKIEEPIEAVAIEYSNGIDITDMVKVENKIIPGKIGLFKYEDVNKNGIYDEGDKALKDAKFALKDDKDSDEFVTDEVTTDEKGKAIFENLELGKTYYIVETESPTGFQKLENAIEAVSKETVDLEDITDLVKIGNKAETTEVDVVKTWNDNGNQDGKRPEKITVKLLADGKEVDSKEVTEADGWKCSFTELDKYKDGKEIVYTVDEEDVKDYTKQINGNEIVNTYVPEKTKVEGTKTWNDNGNQDGKRPEKITVKLLADGKEVDSKEVTEADGWKYSFAELDKYKDGKVIVYTVDEEDVKDYTKQINGTNIINTYSPEKTNVSGTKTWNDGGNVDGLRPEKITIYLLADGTKVDSKEISEADGWKYSFTNLDKYKDGKEIVYTVDEKEIEGYTKQISGNDIINTHTPETTKVEGTKTWNDGGNKYKKRPDTITVYLLANGERVDSVEISEANNWSYTFDELSPRDEDGKVIQYTVDESEVEGYTKQINGYDLINTYVEEFTSVAGTKTWEDENDADGLRPKTLKIMLYADGEEIDSTIMTAETGWKYSFNNLPKYNEEGKEVVYTVDEEKINYYTKEQDGYDFKNTHIVEKLADLKLIKFISAINGVELEGESVRFKGYDVSPLKDDDKTTTTANYELDKTPILVNKGDVVTYTIMVFNEGEIDAYARLIMDDVPEGLQYIASDATNIEYEWTPLTSTYNIEKDPTKAVYTVTEYLLKDENMLKAYDGGDKLDCREVKISFLVVSENTNEDIITNHAQISRQTYGDDKGKDVRDIDSVPRYWRDGDDDQDIDNIIVTYTDLALRKFITKVNGKDVTPSREPEYDATPLLNGETTASYTKANDVVNVSKDDIVTYAFRVYNEGTKDEFVTLIKDDIPEGLEFVQTSELNKNNGWKMVDELGNEVKYAENAKYIVCDGLKNDLIKAFNKETKELDFKTIEVEFKVVAPEKYTKVMTNYAQISAHMDSNGNVTKDRDSTPDEWKDGDDDQDIEKVKITYADLALKKFITEIDGKELAESRVPSVDVTELKNNSEATEASYTMLKDVVEVKENNVVVYTLRIYNEGSKTVAPALVKDDIPEGLEFLPENEINKKYGWYLVDAEDNKVTDASNAKYVVTEYLKDEFIQGFDRESMDTLDYRDVKVAFKVLATKQKDEIRTNYAQISKEIDQNRIDVDDIDSTPNKWENEDDEDIESVRVKYFDLALKKWVTKAIVIENGKERVVNTGITDETNPEPVVKVDLKKSKIDNVVVKFEYDIKVTNEGEIAGYAEEIEDRIPEGLKFVQEDNLDWEVVDGRVVTHQLANTLLQPGESETVTILLTWINKSNNLGLKTNIAEITDDSDENKESITDIDSTPNNKVPGEDDIDDAAVMLTIKTGAATVYTGVIMGVISILGIGIFGIKKYVLN